jgi:PAS domain S-box-containing protein
MQHLKIPEKLLPPGSTIINAPKVFYQLPKELVWTIGISVLLLLVTLIFLVSTMIGRRRVERKIKDQLTFQETLMDTNPQLVSWKNLDFQYIGANRTFANFFGLNDPSEVISKRTRDVIQDQEYVQWSQNADVAVVKDKEAFRKIRKKLTDYKGNEAWIEVNKVPLRDQSGKIVGILSTAENITRELDLERQLLQSQKMEAIGTLAGGIAHDFNNILTSIINSTELASGDVAPDSQTSRDLARVLKAARRGGRVVKQILAFSKPSQEGFRLNGDFSARKHRDAFSYFTQCRLCSCRSHSNLSGGDESLHQRLSCLEGCGGHTADQAGRYYAGGRRGEDSQHRGRRIHSAYCCR